MIPVSLRLRNFMCYREGLPPLEFGELHVACLSGANGAGKSALLDAITWALWGKARSRYDDVLITTGAQEMEVEFEFLLEGNHYRVFRRRDRAARGGRGQTQLDLQVYGALGWRSMSDENVRSTEQSIIDLLRMDYDTFINSAFLLQGRADEFTIKPPAERKRILGEILGLAYYDTLEQRAREQERQQDRSVQTLSAVLQDMEAQLARREEVEQTLGAAQQTVDQSEQETTRLQQDLDQIRTQIAGLEATARQTEDLRNRLSVLTKEESQLEERLAQQQARIQSSQVILERAQEIEGQHSLLLELREQNQAMAQAAGQLLAMSERQRTLEQALERARSRHLSEREVLRHALNEIDQQLQEKPAIDARLRELEQQLAVLKEKSDRQASIQQQIQELTAQVRALKAECQRLREEMELLREKLDLLEESTTHCPLCQSPLDPEAHEHIRLTYQTEGQEKRDLYRGREANIRQIEAQIDELKEAQRKLEQELKQAPVLERQMGTLEKDQKEVERQTEERIRKQERLHEVETILDGGSYASEERAALAELQQKISSIHYNRQEHQALQQKLEQQKHTEEEYRQLRTARETLEAETRHLEELQATWQGRQDEATRVREQLAQLEVQISGLPDMVEHCQQLEDALKTAQGNLSGARLALGAAQRELERLQEVEQTCQQKKQAHQEALERRGIYQELATSLGKRGVQAMLIETAIPEIEKEANELLRRMTGGEMDLQLAMQRQTKQGSVTETLDINISDMYGTRPYESYSGGERFRINFALRIALSRLLARRAGASLKTLVIDEGFGTQDTEGRERLIEAIQIIQDEFEKILVITHIHELKDMFPARIEVEKTSEGSHWTIM